MGRINLALAVLAPAFLGSQLAHAWAHHRNLLNILNEGMFIADRPLAARTAFQVHLNVFINVFGLGPVKSRVACFASGPQRVWIAFVFRAPERGRLPVDLPLQLF
jgi:hypothetical protein